MRWLLVAVLLFVPQAENGRFRISLNGGLVGSEEFSVLRSGGGFVASGQLRLRVDGQSVEAESRMELDAEFNPVSYEYRSGNRSLRMEIGEPTTLEITVDGVSNSLDIRFPEGGVIVDDNFFHHYALLLNQVGEGGGEVQAFVPQQLTTGTIRVEPAGSGRFDLTTENLRLEARIDGEGRLVRLAAPDSSVIVER
jgi:hypothetical protein